MTAPGKDARKSGVGGWLLVFCILNVFITPAVWIATLVFYFRVASYVEGSGTFLVAQTATTLFVSAFSIYAGVKLWRVDPRGLSIARAYLITALVVSELSPMLLGLVPNPFLSPEARGGIAGEMSGRLLVPNLFAFCVWWFYLKKSRRVQDTYLLIDRGASQP